MLLTTRQSPDTGARIPPAPPCVMLIPGATGDLTRRLLLPSLYNLAADGLLSQSFAVVGAGRTPLSTEEFRLKQREQIQKFVTRGKVDPGVWNWLESRLHYKQGNYEDPAAYLPLRECLREVSGRFGTENNTLVYMALAPKFFEPVARNLAQAGIAQQEGWSRLIVEKPFGVDLPSAVHLNRALLESWREDQIYRIDHYLGKETVQNLLAFRFMNRIFLPIWNRAHIDHIQISVMESVGVEGRGAYYDQSGALRDMVQNHILQMLAFLCMELPSSLEPEAVRDEKLRLLQAIRVIDPDEVSKLCVRAQYDAGTKPDGSAVPAFRNEKDVSPNSMTPTFVALKLEIENERWRGVPIYIRTGKSLWKRATEITVHLKPSAHQPAEPCDNSDSNLLIFHIQPNQAIELRLLAKHPGPKFTFQKVDMRFDYAENFIAARGTGYESLLYAAMRGDATLFSRTDFVEVAWRAMQPILDGWAAKPNEALATYPAGSWGPRAASDLLKRDGRCWHEIATRDVLMRNDIFRDANPVFLNSLALALHARSFHSGEPVVQVGEPGNEMFFVCRGELEVIAPDGRKLCPLKDGDLFGEIGVLLDQPRVATVRAVTPCDLFVLRKADLLQVLRDFPDVETKLRHLATERCGPASRT
jgi:glucose-6-phosphate 1-dehydrogenase